MGRGHPLPLVRRCHKGGRGQEQRPLLPDPNPPVAPSSSASHPSSRSRRSRSSHSDTWLQRHPLPKAAPAFPHPLRRGSPAPPDRISYRRVDPGSSTPPGLLLHFRPQNLLLHLPFRTYLEEVVSRLRGVLAPPALGSGAHLSPVQVLSSAGVPRIQLVEPRGEPLGAVGFYAIGLLALRHAAVCLGGVTPGPSTRLCLLLLRDFPLEVGERSWERPIGVWLPCRSLGPLVGLLVADDPFVGQAPPDLYGDTWPRPS